MFENNFTKFWKAVSLKKITKNVQNWFIFRQQKIKFKPKCLAWSCHYATGCLVAFLGDISILTSGWIVKESFCCPALELFHCLPPLKNSAVCRYKMQQNAISFQREPLKECTFVVYLFIYVLFWFLFQTFSEKRS